LASNATKALNLGLRSATLATRFMFIFFLAKYLDPADVGYYGIFTATVGYVLYFVGLDFYTYVSREIGQASAARRGQLLKGQAALSALLYLAFLPIAVWLLSVTGWPDYLVWWFVPILILEHINQEVSRLLIALSEQLASSVILFLRQGSWALVVVALMSFNASSRNLNAVMGLWMIAGIFAASAGVWKIRKLNARGWSMPVDWAWVKKGVRVSIAFLIATLALRGVQTFDRYWLEMLGSVEVVAAYVLLLGVASTLLIFLDAGIFAFAYPALIQHNHSGDTESSRKQVKRLLFQTLGISLVFGLVSWTALPYFLDWIGNPIYKNALPWYPLLLSAMTINALGMVPHYALYAKGVDRPIVLSHIFGLFGFLVSTWLLGDVFSAIAVPIGLNIAFLIILVWKAAAYFSVIKKEDTIAVFLKNNINSTPA